MQVKVIVPSVLVTYFGTQTACPPQEPGIAFGPLDTSHTLKPWMERGNCTPMYTPPNRRIACLISARLCFCGSAYIWSGKELRFDFLQEFSTSISMPPWSVDGTPLTYPHHFSYAVKITESGGVSSMLRAARDQTCSPWPQPAMVQSPS